MRHFFTGWGVDQSTPLSRNGKAGLEHGALAVHLKGHALEALRAYRLGRRSMSQTAELSTCSCSQGVFASRRGGHSTAFSSSRQASPKK